MSVFAETCQIQRLETGYDAHIVPQRPPFLRDEADREQRFHVVNEKDGWFNTKG
jgi:hypothetical protein